MKKPNRLSHKGGFTILEMTITIFVILGLIAASFIGFSAYKSGTDRTTCVISQTRVQDGMRSYCNMNGIVPGATVTGLKSHVIGSGKFLEVEPVCPAGGTYTFGGDTVPAVGTLFMSCSLAPAPNNHKPARVDGVPTS